MASVDYYRIETKIELSDIPNDSKPNLSLNIFCNDSSSNYSFNPSIELKRTISRFPALSFSNSTSDYAKLSKS